MPELPEVETTRRGLASYLIGTIITAVNIREPRLRWPVAPELANILPGQTILAVERRAKYLLIQVQTGWLIAHLGMSGSLRIVPSDTPLRKHDHVEFVLGNQYSLRFHDPRRFGVLLWSARPLEHPLLCELGPEPWDSVFTAEYLYARAQGRHQAVKSYIMDNRTVVGVGNIYANEALFVSSIHPARAAGRVSLARYRVLTKAIQDVLASAIQQGGTTLRDFVNSHGEPGYFKLSLQVYERAGEHCIRCQRQIKQIRLGQRSSYFCPYCQR